MERGAPGSPPTVTKLAIGAQTKTRAARGAGAAAQPPVPAAPESKLGFSFEMSLPLSARTGWLVSRIPKFAMTSRRSRMRLRANRQDD